MLVLVVADACTSSDEGLGMFLGGCLIGSSMTPSEITDNYRTCRDSIRQVAEALGHLPDVGYIHVVKTADGTDQTYTVPTDVSGTSDMVETYSVWEWEVTFVTKTGNLPLMAAVWSDGRTLPGQDDGSELSGRAARLTCGTCATFGSASWSSTAETIVGLRMEVCRCNCTAVTAAEHQNFKFRTYARHT